MSKQAKVIAEFTEKEYQDVIEVVLDCCAKQEMSASWRFKALRAAIEGFEGRWFLDPTGNGK